MNKSENEELGLDPFTQEEIDKVMTEGMFRKSRF